MKKVWVSECVCVCVCVCVCAFFFHFLFQVFKEKNVFQDNAGEKMVTIPDVNDAVLVPADLTSKD